MGTTTKTLRTPASGNNTWGFVLQLEMSATTDITTNKSTITWALKLYNNGSYGFSQYGIGWVVNINGEVGSHNRNTSDRYSCPNNGDVLTLQSGSTTVQHNTDGTKTISCSASIDMANRGNPSSAGAGAGPMTISATNWVLETIPRASTMTVPSFTVGSSGTMTISMASSSFSHTITYSFSGLTGTAASVNAGVSSASWTPPTTFYAKLPNSTSGTVSLVLNTYSGSTLVGSKAYTATVSVGSSIKPTAPSITLSPVNTNAWISSKGLYVAGYTKIRVQSSATAGSGASMSSYTISGAFSATGSDVTSSVISSSGSKTVTVTATDSRGRANSASASVTYLAYSYPSLTTFTAVRGTYSGGSWTSNANGDHIRVEAVGTVSLSANGNTATKTVKIGNTNPNATSGNYYYFTSTNATTSYVVTGTITDSLGNTSTRGLTVPTVSVPFNINVDLPGAGFGMIAQSAKSLEVAQDWSLVVNGKHNYFNYMPNSFQTGYSSGNNGYSRIAQIVVTGTYLGGPITFECARITDKRPVVLHFAFSQQNTTDPTDPTLYYEDKSGTSTGYPFVAFAVKEATSTWGIYVQKGGSGDVINVRTYVPYSVQQRVNISYVEARYASIPAGAVMATMSYGGTSVITPTLTGVSTSTAANEVARYWRSGNCVTLNVDIILASAGTATIFQLPAEYRPPVVMTFGIPHWSDNARITQYCVVNLAGDVNIYCGNNTNRLLFNASWSV